MNQTKRFTRSSINQYRSQRRLLSKSRQQIDLIGKINESISSKNYNQALTLMRAASQSTHWLQCQKAFVLFQIGRIARSLSAVRNALKIDRHKCYHCYQLLLKIIQKNPSSLKSFVRDIQAASACQNLPKKVKSQFEILKSEIDSQKEQPSVINQKFQQLTQYYANKGLLFKKVEIVQIQDQYRVARAKSTIKARQVIIFVPQKQMITLQMARSMQEVKKLLEFQHKLRSPKHCFLSIFLLLHMERGRESPYYNYIQCLPKRLDTFPVYYGDDLLQELGGTYFLTIIKRKKIDVQEDYQIISSTLPQLNSILTYQRFLWARMVVSSRIFGVAINGKKTDALVPIADMLNHKIPKMTSWFFSDEKKGFVVQNADEQIPKGHQIFDSYGLKCNSRFLLNYGFTLPQNSFNQVSIKLKRIRNSKINTPIIKLTRNIDSQQFRNFLAYYRKAVSQIKNKHVCQTDQQQSKTFNFVSHQNQHQVWRFISQTMKQQLQQYKTTIRADQKLLRSSEALSPNQKNCIQIRLGQKMVLDYYIKMSKKMIDYFSRRRLNYDLSEYETYLREIQPNFQGRSQ